jgi:hypothetical protein
MAEYDSARALATKLIGKKGRLCNYQRRAVGTPADADKPWNPGPEDVEVVEVKAVFLNYISRKIDGTSIRVGDKEVLISAMDLANVEPTMKDTIEDGEGVVWRVINYENLTPGEQQVLYTIQVRK